MLKIGEQSGSIDKMMDKAATYYEDELDAKIKTISTTIEPILMVFLGHCCWWNCRRNFGSGI
jgi:type II secretory pathway component PulF